jgi:hypothetical protein
MGFFRNLYTIAKEVRKKGAEDRSIQIFKKNKGSELYWQQLVDMIAQAQHWRIVKNQCLLNGKQKGFEMASENEQGYLEMLDRVEKEVGIDKKELDRRITKILGR